MVRIIDVRHHRPRQRGQGLVELALVLPVLALALFGLLDVGRLVYTNSALSQAAREGARLAATEAARIDAECGTGTYAPVCPATVAELLTHVTTAVNRMTIGLGPVTDVHISCNTGASDDAAPTGDWTDTPGGGGNGCLNSAGEPAGAVGYLVSVRVEYAYAPMTPVISSILGTVPISGSATMVIH